MRTSREVKIHGKVFNRFYLKIIKLITKYLSNRCGEKFEIVTSSPCIRKLQQDKENITETNKTQIKPKQKKTKLKPRQPVQTKKQKQSLSRKEYNVGKQKFFSTGCRGTEKESQINWIV